MDSHKYPKKANGQQSSSIDEGALYLMNITGPYQIPYGVMVPKNRKGLLVPVAISATHVALSTVRMEPIWASLGQAAGVAAALAIDNGQELRDVPVRKIQDTLLQQDSMLFFYMDMPGERADFEAVQRLSVLGALEGDENYYFNPDQPISLGDFAKLAVVGLGIPVSVTAEHFKDVPWDHPAFKFIETLYDHSTQSTEPFLPYQVRNYMNYFSWDHFSNYQPSSIRAPAFANPEQAVTGGLARQILSGLLMRSVEVPDVRFLTRGEAAGLIYRLKADKH